MSNTIEVTVPDIGDFSDVPVIEVLVSVGDSVEAEDSLLTLESDKATMEIPSPAAGVISELKVKLDDTVSEGDVVALLEASDAAEAGDAAESEPATTEESAAVERGISPRAFDEGLIGHDGPHHLQRSGSSLGRCS